MQSCMVHNHCKSLWTYGKSFLIQKFPSRQACTKMADKLNIRWAFNAKTWQPSREQILAASSFIQQEEKQRIAKFYFQDDARSSLIGRLMIRKFSHMVTLIPYADLRFDRDDRGKPFLLGVENSLSFNVSHQGDYVVLAGNTETNIGVDTMKIEPPANKDVKEFFRLMTRQFSSQEWNTIKNFKTEMEQMACFYRIWCLKESYVKNVGIGITIPLQEISFTVETLDLNVGEAVTDTVLYVKDEERRDWLFEETLLDDKHMAAVAFQGNRNDFTVVPFSFLSFEELVREARPLCMPDQQFADDFMRKQLKHF